MVYLHKSKSTDAEGRLRELECGAARDSSTQFSWFTGTKVQILTQKAGCENLDAVLHATLAALESSSDEQRRKLLMKDWYSHYLVYWYKSTNTDAEGACAGGRGSLLLLSCQTIMLGTQFTCFTSTKAQMLTAEELMRSGSRTSGPKRVKCCWCLCLLALLALLVQKVLGLLASLKEGGNAAAGGEVPVCGCGRERGRESRREGRRGGERVLL